ncbi:MAG: stage V sporulation protein E, partial [Bacillota bacterium]
MQAAIIERTRSVRRSGNWGIPVVAVLLAGFGVLMVYSASYYSAQQQTGDAFFYMKKQLAGLVLGGIAMAVMALFPYRKLKKLKWPALIISLVLLAAVFVPGLGVENYGATRWIGIGPITIQPSEISKYGFVLFASAYASEKPERMQRFVGMLPVLGAGGAVCVLIILEPNMSVTMCTGMIMLAMLFLSGVKMRHLLVILLPIAAAVPVLIIMEPYRLQRLYAFLDPWSSPQGEGYQLIQSLYALGNGGWFGTGLFRSVQKYRYLPFAESDFI